MSELLAFKLLEGNSDSFNNDIFSEFKKNNITGFEAHEDSYEFINNDFINSISKPHIRFFSDNLSTSSFNKSLKILEKSLKKLPEFELFIETPNKNIVINEKDDLNIIFEKFFIDYAIYNPQTNSYVLYQVKSSSKNKINTPKDILSNEFKDIDLTENGWEKIDISYFIDKENSKYTDTEDILLERLENLESKVNIIKKANIVRYLRHYPKLIDLLEETVIEAKRRLSDDSILKLKLNTDENIEYEFLVLTVGNPNKAKQEVFEVAEDLLNNCAEKLINIEGSIIVKPGYRSNTLDN